MMVDWNGADGLLAASCFGGAVDRLYARPLASSDGGSVDSALNWLLSQPDAEIAPPRGAPVPLRAVGAPGQPTYDVRCRTWTAATRSSTPAARPTPPHGRARRRGRRRRGQTAATSADAADALAAAGAAAMVAYAGDGAELRRHARGASALSRSSRRGRSRPRGCSARAGAQPRVRHAPHDRSTSTTSSARGTDRVPAGAVLDGARSPSAARRAYDTLGGTTCATGIALGDAGRLGARA